MDEIFKETIIGETPPYKPFEALPEAGEELGKQLTEGVGTEVAEELTKEVGKELTEEVAEEAIEEVTKTALGQATSAVGPVLDTFTVATDPEERDPLDVGGKALKAFGVSQGWNPIGWVSYGVGTLMDLMG